MPCFCTNLFIESVGYFGSVVGEKTLGGLVDGLRVGCGKIGWEESFFRKMQV